VSFGFGGGLVLAYCAKARNCRQECRRDHSILCCKLFCLHGCYPLERALIFTSSSYSSLGLDEDTPAEALIDCEATLTTVNRVAGRCLFDDFRRRSLPLLYVALTVLALLVFDGTDGLPRQEGAILAGLFGARLDCFGLNAGKASFDHHGLPPVSDFEAAILWHRRIIGQSASELACEGRPKRIRSVDEE
jgi:hypothetical protein